MSNGDHHNVIQTRKMSNKQAIFKESSSTKKGPLAKYVDRLHDRYGEMFQRSSFKDPWARSEARRSAITTGQTYLIIPIDSTLRG